MCTQLLCVLLLFSFQFNHHQDIVILGSCQLHRLHFSSEVQNLISFKHILAVLCTRNVFFKMFVFCRCSFASLHLVSRRIGNKEPWTTFSLAAVSAAQRKLRLCGGFSSSSSRPSLRATVLMWNIMKPRPNPASRCAV